MINVCTSMLCLVRESLLENDFASNMKMLQVSKPFRVDVEFMKSTFLQNYPEADMRLILNKAELLSL